RGLTRSARTGRARGAGRALSGTGAARCATSGGGGRPFGAPCPPGRPRGGTDARQWPRQRTESPDMKRLVLVAALAATDAPALATDVGVSVSIGQPGFYGTIDIGNVPRPQVIYAEPVVIQPVPVGVVRRPVYLHVPPGHA